MITDFDTITVTEYDDEYYIIDNKLVIDIKLFKKYERIFKATKLICPHIPGNHEEYDIIKLNRFYKIYQSMYDDSLLCKLRGEAMLQYEKYEKYYDNIIYIINYMDETDFSKIKRWIFISNWNPKENYSEMLKYSYDYVELLVCISLFGNVYTNIANIQTEKLKLSNISNEYLVYLLQNVKCSYLMITCPIIPRKLSCVSIHLRKFKCLDEEYNNYIQDLIIQNFEYIK